MLSYYSLSNSIEGTHIIVFYHNDKWFITTKKCLDAKTSKWNGETSYYDMFMNTIKDKFNLDDLDKNYCYHFNLINVNNYRNTKVKTSQLELIFITEKYSLKVIQDDKLYKLLNFNKSKIDFKDNNELINNINNYQTDINNLDNYNYLYKQIEDKYDDIEERNKHIKDFEKTQNDVFLTNDGINIILYYKNDLTPIICKIQHPIYVYISNHPVLKNYLNYPKYDLIYYKFILDECNKKKIKPFCKFKTGQGF